MSTPEKQKPPTAYEIAQSIVYTAQRAQVAIAQELASELRLEPKEGHLIRDVNRTALLVRALKDSAEAFVSCAEVAEMMRSAIPVTPPEPELSIVQ